MVASWLLVHGGGVLCTERQALLFMTPLTPFRMVFGMAAVTSATITVTAVRMTTIRIKDAVTQRQSRSVRGMRSPTTAKGGDRTGGFWLIGF